MQVFMVTGLFAGQHNTKLHGTITDVLNTEQLSYSNLIWMCYYRDNLILYLNQL